MNHPKLQKFPKIAVIGLGYVGLPLARLFATKYPVVGFDINQKRIQDLRQGNDNTLAVEDDVLQSVLVQNNPFMEHNGAFENLRHQPFEDLKHQPLEDLKHQPFENLKHQPFESPAAEALEAQGLYCTSDTNDIQVANTYIITVPTPVDHNHKPDLSPLYKASETVGKVLKKGDIVIYESTVYPGATEEECVPILAQISGLQFNVDFFVGYSPERINPGDTQHTVDKILKVTSGSTPEVAHKIDLLYKSVITAGTYLAPTIKVAEAAKVIENSQRDINIAFVNELAKIFNVLGIDTQEVLKAAATKWNFLPFKPGLVGGHCIGVDPYYLAQKAQAHGYHPEIILAGRRLNDTMGEYVASQVVKLMIKKSIVLQNASVLILGITFKENCPDIRNTKVIDMIRSFQDYGLNVSVYDPWADPVEVFDTYAIHSTSKLPVTQYDAIVHAVAHTDFLQIDINTLKKSIAIIYDVKSVLPITVDGRL